MVFKQGNDNYDYDDDDDDGFLRVSYPQARHAPESSGSWSKTGHR